MSTKINYDGLATIVERAVGVRPGAEELARLVNEYDWNADRAEVRARFDFEPWDHGDINGVTPEEAGIEIAGEAYWILVDGEKQVFQPHPPDFANDTIIEPNEIEGYATAQIDAMVEPIIQSRFVESLIARYRA